MHLKFVPAGNASNWAPVFCSMVGESPFEQWSRLALVPNNIKDKCETPYYKIKFYYLNPKEFLCAKENVLYKNVWTNAIKNISASRYNGGRQCKKTLRKNENSEEKNI